MDALFGVVAALVQNSLLIEKAVLVNPRAVMGGLGTEFAVFRASAAPAVDDAAKVDMVAAESLSDTVCPLEKLTKVCGDEAVGIVLSAEASAADYFVCKSEKVHVYTLLTLCLLMTGRSFFPSIEASMHRQMSPGTASTKR